MPDNDNNEKDQRIRERAYLIWIDEGEPEGRENEHWERAKVQIEDEDRQREAEKDGVKPPPGPTFGS
jgi:hypothetical protein